MPRVAVSSRMVEGVPLGDPIHTDARTERFHLDMECVQFLLEEFSALIQLELSETFGQDSLDLLMRMGLQEVQDHRIADCELAVDGFRLSGQPFGQDRQVDIRRGSHDRKAHEIFSTTTGSSRDLLDFADGQVSEVPGLADARLSDHDRAGGKIDARRQGRRGEYRIEMALPHQLLNRDFPRRQMPGMMSGNPDPPHNGNQRVLGNAGVLNRDPLKCDRNRLLPCRRKHEIGMVKGLHGLVTGPA